MVGRYSGRQYGILIREDMEKYLWLEDSLSSNTVMVQAVYENYNPSKFVNHVNSYGLNKKLNMDFEGRRTCYSATKRQNWSNISFLGWPSAMGLSQCRTLAFYNAVANNGVVKPQFVSEIKEWNKTIVKMKSH
jgi:cell division protein FtsI (penicillin-binding protein 3)